MPSFPPVDTDLLHKSMVSQINVHFDEAKSEQTIDWFDDWVTVNITNSTVGLDGHDNKKKQYR